MNNSYINGRLQLMKFLKKFGAVATGEGKSADMTAGRARWKKCSKRNALIL